MLKLSEPIHQLPYPEPPSVPYLKSYRFMSQLKYIEHAHGAIGTVSSSGPPS